MFFLSLVIKETTIYYQEDKTLDCAETQTTQLMIGIGNSAIQASRITKNFYDPVSLTWLTNSARGLF